MKILIAVIISVVLALGLFQWYVKFGSAQYVEADVEAAYLAEGLALATSVKHQIAYFYAENGRFPSSNKELGLPGPEQFLGQSLTKLAISDGGVIAITFNELSGVKGGIIRLLPDAGNPAILQWRCETPSYKNIGKWAPQCKYTSNQQQ